jgi:hypothetical protein
MPRRRLVRDRPRIHLRLTGEELIAALRRMADTLSHRRSLLLVAPHREPRHWRSEHVHSAEIAFGTGALRMQI